MYVTHLGFRVNKLQGLGGEGGDKKGSRGAWKLTNNPGLGLWVLAVGLGHLNPVLRKL